MAETKPTATAASKSSSAPAKHGGNSISWIAPLVCVLAGYSIWRFMLLDSMNPILPEDSGPTTWVPKMPFIVSTKEELSFPC